MILEEIIKRKSVRAYEDKPVPEQLLEEVLEAGRLAPSASNIQPWKFIITTDENLRKELTRASYDQKFMLEAPVIITACITGEGYPMGDWYDSAILDTALALDHMTLQAAHTGLGTCWIGAFKEEEVKKILEIPEDIKVVALLTLGFPKDPSIKPKSRKPLSSIVVYEKYK